MQDFDKALGHRVRLLRKSFNYSQMDIAEYLGKSPQQVQKYETGANRITAHVLFQLKELFNLDWDDFFQNLNDCNTDILGEQQFDTNHYLNAIPSKRLQYLIAQMLQEIGNV